tara:strand:+ start:10294 stop:10443 length:150 start_codon:yes stop_codon:yes gene_type:complete
MNALAKENQMRFLKRGQKVWKSKNNQNATSKIMKIAKIVGANLHPKNFL